MIVNPIKTRLVMPGSISLLDLIIESIEEIPENSIIAVTSKVVAICEGRIVPKEGTDFEALIESEAEYYLPKKQSGQGHRTIAKHTLVSGAGIDESNVKDSYVLLPKDPQKSANEIREGLRHHYKVKDLGVIITDSVSTPLRLGASGAVLGWSGFKALKDYRGTPDLFGRPFKVSRASIAGGLAATATLVMGEGDEQTPIAIVEEVPFVEFEDQNPTEDELKYIIDSFDDDIFSPLLKGVEWKKGKQKNT
jgi:coenzyme F420-0:L-glutamate ligase